MAETDLSRSYLVVSALFLRILALIYLAAFLSTAVQIIPLAGEQGILPLQDRLDQVLSEQGWAGVWSYPTLFWLDAGNDALFGATLLGCVFSVFLLLNVLPRLSAVMLFVLYLSLFHAGQLFMNFQWDYLLLESGFLAIFLVGGSNIIVWLYRWLIFRVRFLSGVSKLLSQDPTWANLTALTYFFEVQPLPHWGGWYAHQLPDWLLRFGTGAALVIEILVPFLMFLPRRFRLIGAWLTVIMQLAILATSNHNYANFLVLALCLFLFDDRALTRVLPQAVARGLADSQVRRASNGLFGRALTGTVGVMVLVVSLGRTAQMLLPQTLPAPVTTVLERLRPFRIVNNYHVFPTMKTQRVELVIEGSPDGVEWRSYEFKYKPGDPSRRPEVIVPHHPRVDWLMWFVPMHPVFLSWFDPFLDRLAANEPAVTGLLETNPFPDQAPRYLRVSAYRYTFTNPKERAETGRWWNREYLGPFTGNR